MDISKGLILKGTAATAAVATTSTGAYYHEEIGDILSSVFSGEDEEEKTGKESLGLPDGWDWPTDAEKTKTNDLTVEQLKTVNFDEKGGSEINSSAAVSLTIEKVDGNGDFPEGFKFIFKPKGDNNNDVTITAGSSVSITLKKGMDLEFKIKVTDGKWSLERAWDINKLAEKVGMTSCESSDNTCTFTKSLNVKDGESKVTGITISGSKKLKFESGQKDYNQGLKFTAEETISWTGGTGNGVTKLKNGATYEIRELDDGGKKWFLVKKTPSNKEKENEEINKKLKNLGIPTTCLLEGERKLIKDCELTDENIKAIKFDGKGNNNLSISSTGNVKLKIEKVDDSEKTFGAEKLKFTFETTKDVEIAGKDPKEYILKKGTNPEFKIKNGTGGDLTLERAWTVAELARKAGLNCPNGVSTTCTFENSANIYKGKNRWIIGTKVEGSNVNITFTKDQDNYNQGYKFTITGTNIKVSGGTPQSSPNTVTNLDTNGGYEIKEQNVNGGKKWFLSKVTSSSITT